ncbi:MAG: hypothetical protein LBM02_09985 [Lachnospiraceae bacterium]|jgi:hypothetical protein|nr:hypothetical protein [Lachnospiraceae bacterium]
MQKETEILLKEYKEEFENYKNYLDSNNWIDDISEDKNGNLYSDKLNVELSIVSTVIKSMKKFKEDVGDDLRLKPIQKFISDTVKIIEKHISRIDLYKKTFPLSVESGEKEVKFQSELFGKKTSTKVELAKLNIDENSDSKKSLNLFFSDNKAPLLMREYLCDAIPIIEQKTSQLDINFNAPVINPASSKEMLINMNPKDIPKWDDSKHYFEQELSTIQFWEEEIRKIKNGVNIGGYYIHPWLYWHLNIFMLANGSGKDRKATNPSFRDNEYFFIEMIKKAEEHGRRGLLMYGSRRIAKSVIMGSYLMLPQYTVRNAKCTVLGFSKIPDLEAIVNYISESITAMVPALRINANELDLNGTIKFGLKKTAQERYDYSITTITNLDSSSKQGIQKTAGGSPDAFGFDEIGKGKCIKPWLTALPSFADSTKGGKWKCVPLLAGTAGEAGLSRDAELMLKNPESYSLLPMDWDLLESKVDPENITWKRESFGFFVPAQMSALAPAKHEIPFSKFLGKDDNSELDLIKINTTDWKSAKEHFEEERKNAANDIELLVSKKIFSPMSVEDCYMTAEVSKFPGNLAKIRKRVVEENGLQGQKVWLIRNGDKIYTQQTDDPIISEYPYRGGNTNAPIVILDDPYHQSTDKPPLGLYCIGFDDAKQDKSNGDSVLSATVFKRSYEGGEWADRIVAYYDSRPNRKVDYYKNLYLLMKFYNARVLHENEDNGFIEYLEDKHIEDVYTHISDGIGLATEENLNRNRNRRFGWSPTPGNIYRLEEQIVRYVKEENVTIGDEEGLDGIDKINHPMLLEEFYKYKKGQNADRIRSFGLALKLARYYDKTYSYMKKRQKDTNEEDYAYFEKQKKKEVNGFTFTNKLVKF